MQGTNVVEVLETLPDETVVKVYGNGWRPRSYSLKIYRDGNYMEITGEDNITSFMDILNKFYKKEMEYERSTE